MGSVNRDMLGYTGVILYIVYQKLKPGYSISSVFTGYIITGLRRLAGINHLEVLLKLGGMVNNWFATLLSGTRCRLTKEFVKELQILETFLQHKLNILGQVENMFEKLYQRNHNENNDDQILRKFEIILKENFMSCSNKTRSENEYPAQLSEAEKLIENIFAEFWPDDQEENIEMEIVKAEEEFENIF